MSPANSKPLWRTKTYGPVDAPPTVTEEIAAERRRQIEVEGWTPEHDDDHNLGEIALAAAAYAVLAASFTRLSGAATMADKAMSLWPWHPSWLKHQDPRRDLIRAAALIVAEIERLDRAAQPPATPESEPANRIIEGLHDALAYVRGDLSRGTATTVQVKATQPPEPCKTCGGGRPQNLMRWDFPCPDCHEVKP